MKRKNQPKSSSKPPNKQSSTSAINIEDDNEQPDSPSAPGSSLESGKLDDKKNDQSKSKATPAEAKGKRGRPKGSKNTKTEKESKAKGSTKSKKNVKEESEDEENVSENEELPGTQEIEEVYEHIKTTEVIVIEEENDPQTQINKIVHELSVKTLNIKNPPPTMEEDKEESKVPENPEEQDDISIAPSEETEQKNNTQETVPDEEPCQICYSKISQKFLQPETRHLFQIVRCKGEKCNIAVHRICVGKESILSKRVSEFLCDSCQSGVKREDSKNKYECHVCKAKDGYLHNASNGKWCHLLCAISTSNIFIKDVANMSIDASSFKKDVGRIPNGNKCSICQVKVGTLRSTDKDNGHFCHLHCALRKAVVDPKNSNWSVNFELRGTASEEYEENKTVIKNVNVRSQVVIENIETIQKKLDKDIQNHIKNKLESRDKSPKKKSKTNEEVSSEISRIFDKAKKDFALRFNLPLNQPDPERTKSFELDHFSGKLNFTEKFRGHRQDNMEVEDDDEDENLLNGNSKKLISFLSNELIDEDSLYDTSHSLVPTGKVVKGHLPAFKPIKSISLPEVLFFVNILQKRIEAATKNICEDGSLVEIFHLAEMIPFAVTGLLTPVYEKFYTAFAADHLIGSKVDSCSLLKIYDSLTKAFDQDNLKKTVARLHHAESLEENYFNKPCQIITQKTKDLHSLIQHLRFLIDEFYNDLKDFFANKAGSSNTTPIRVGTLTPFKGQLPTVPDYKIVKLFERAKEIGLPTNSAEMELLDSFLNDSKFALQVVEEPPKKQRQQASPAPSPNKRMQEESPQKSIPRSEKGSPSKALLRDFDHLFGSPSFNHGKISQKKILADLPPRDSLVKKPAYLKVDKDWVGKEKEYHVQLRLLEKKQKLQEIEDELASLGSIGTINERQTLERKKERALTWKQNYLDALSKNDGRLLKKVIADIDDIDIYLDEMKEAYGHKIEWAHCRIKVEGLTKLLSEPEPIDFEALEEVVKEGDQIPQCEPDEGGKFANLKAKYEIVKKWQNLLIAGEDDLGNPITMPQLELIAEQLRKAKVRIPEKNLLDEKLKINIKIKNLIKERLTTEELEQKINEISEHFSVADESLVEKLNQRLSTANDLSQQAEAFIEGHVAYNLQNLSKMAQLAEKTREEEKLIVAKVNVLDDIVSAYLQFEKIRENLLNTQRITRDKLLTGDFMETEEQLESFIQELENKLNESGELDSDQVEKLGALCEGVKFDLLTSFEPLYNFFQKLLTMIRKGKAKSVLTKQYKRAKDIQDLLSSLPNIQDLPEEDRKLFMQIQKEGAKINAWKVAVQEFFKTKPEETIKNIYERAGDDEDLDELIDEIDTLNQKIEPLLKWFKKDLESYQDLDDETDRLKSLQNKALYINQGLELRKQVEKKKYINLDEIEGLFDLLKEAGLQADNGLCALLDGWCDQVRDVRKEVERDYGRKKDFGELDVKRLKVRHLIQRNATKKTKADAEAMIGTIENLEKYARLDREVKSIESDLQQLKLWEAKVKEATELYKDLYEEGDMEIEQEQERKKILGKQEEISNKLAELKAEMMNLTLRDKKGETSLLLFEWICDAVFLLNGLKKDAKNEEWKSLMQIKDKFEREEANRIRHLVQRLEKVFLKSHRIEEFADKLKHLTTELEAEEGMIEGDQRRESFENLKAMIADCDQCQVPMEHAKRELQEYAKKYENTKTRAQNLLKSTEKKASLNDIESLQIHIRKLPINLFEEYKALDDIVVEANRIKTEVPKVALSDFSKTEELIKRYQDCPVSLPEMKRILEFQENLKKLKSVEEQLTDLSNDQLTLDDLDKIDDIRVNMDKLSKIDEAYSDKLQKYVFIKRCKILQKKKEEVNSGFYLTFSNLKSLRVDGGDLKIRFADDPAVIEAFRFINDLWRKAEDRIRDIEQTQDAEKLSKFSNIVSSFVDIQEVIIEKRAKLTAPRDIQPPKYPTLQYYEPESEERKDPVVPVKRGRGRPRKGQEKNPRNETTASKNRKSKEKSRDREKSDNGLRKKKEEASSKLQPKQMNKIGQYFGKSGPPQKDIMVLNAGPTRKETIVISIKRIFDVDGYYLRLDPFHAKRNAEEIIKIFPSVLESGERLRRLRKKIQHLLVFEAISWRLFTEKNCLKNNFKTFFFKTDEALKKIEDKMQAKSKETGVPVERAYNRPQFDPRRPMPGELRKEKPLVPSKPAINEKKYSVHSDPRQTQLKYDRKRSVDNIRGSQNFVDTGYNAFDNKPETKKVSRSGSRIIESALKQPIKKKGQSRDIIPTRDIVREIEELPTIPDFVPDSHYEDIPPARFEERYAGDVLDSIRPTTKTPQAHEPRHDHIYRILEGSLENVDGTQKLKMALFTCDDSKKISRIPQFTDTDPLKIKFKKHKNKVEDYFNNVLNEDTGIRIISGWVENRISIYQSRCEQIALDFLHTDTIGTTTYDHKSTRILFLHKDQINSTWKSKLKFRTKKLTKTSNPILCFIIISRADRLTKNTRFITPFVEKQLTSTPRKGSFDSLDSLDSLAEWEEELSQASSIGDYEPDFGQLVEPRNIPFDQTSIESGGEDDERPRKPGYNKHGKREYAEYSEDDEGFRPRKKIQVDINTLHELREMDPEDVMNFIADLDDDQRDAYKDALRAMALEEGEDIEPSETQDYTDEEVRSPEPKAPVNPIDNRYPVENLIQEQKYFELHEPKPRSRPFLFNPENTHFFDEPPQSTLPIIMNPNQGLRPTQPFRFEEDNFRNTPSRQLQGHKKGNFGGNKFNNTGKKSGNKNKFNKNNNRKFNKGKGGNNNHHQVQPNNSLDDIVALLQSAKLEGGQVMIPKRLYEGFENFSAQLQQAEFTSTTEITSVAQNADQNSSIYPSQETDPLHAPLSSFKDPNEENK